MIFKPLNILKKLQNKPERERKIILWTIIIALSLIMLVWWLVNLNQKIEKARKQNLFKIEAPEFNANIEEINE